MHSKCEFEVMCGESQHLSHSGLPGSRALGVQPTWTPKKGENQRAGALARVAIPEGTRGVLVWSPRSRIPPKIRTSKRPGMGEVAVQSRLTKGERTSLCSKLGIQCYAGYFPSPVNFPPPKFSKFCRSKVSQVGLK